MMALESNDNDSARDKARKRIERMKIEMRDWIENLNDEESFTNVMMKVLTDYEATGNGYLEIGRTVRGEIGYVGHIPATTMRARSNALASARVIVLCLFTLVMRIKPEAIADAAAPNNIGIGSNHQKRHEIDPMPVNCSITARTGGK
jgi:hypothetical protein